MARTELRSLAKRGQVFNPELPLTTGRFRKTLAVPRRSMRRMGCGRCYDGFCGRAKELATIH
jgi:hypothetical protein